MLLPIPEDVLQAQARERVVDMLLGSLGLSAAAVSAAFATYMIVTRPEGRAVSGTNHVLVARGPGVDHQGVRAIDAPPHPSAAPAATTADQALDFTPTGSIPTMPAHRDAAAAGAVLPDFAVRDVFDDTALVEARGTLQMVRAGSVLPGAGEVLSITRQGEGWVVATAGGTIVQRR